jgi:hypothetical protein
MSPEKKAEARRRRTEERREHAKMMWSLRPYSERVEKPSEWTRLDAYRTFWRSIPWFSGLCLESAERESLGNLLMGEGAWNLQREIDRWLSFALRVHDSAGRTAFGRVRDKVAGLPSDKRAWAFIMPHLHELFAGHFLAASLDWTPLAYEPRGDGDALGDWLMRTPSGVEAFVEVAVFGGRDFEISGEVQGLDLREPKIWRKIVREYEHLPSDGPAGVLVFDMEGFIFWSQMIETPEMDGLLGAAYGRPGIAWTPSEDDATSAIVDVTNAAVLPRQVKDETKDLRNCAAMIGLRLDGLTGGETWAIPLPSTRTARIYHVPNARRSISPEDFGDFQQWIPDSENGKLSLIGTRRSCRCL